MSSPSSPSSLLLLPRLDAGNVLAVAFALGSALVADTINRHVPLPYIDEIFHAPQATRFCVGDYGSYDAKLTTPPGLYLVSLAFGRILPLFDCTDLRFLRATNLVLLVCLPHLLAAIVESYEDQREKRAIQLDTHRLQRQGGPGAAVELPPGYSERPIDGARSTVAMTDAPADPPPSLPRSIHARSKRAGISRETVRAIQEQAKRQAAARAAAHGDGEGEVPASVEAAGPTTGVTTTSTVTNPSPAHASSPPRPRDSVPGSLQSIYSSSAVQRKLRRQRGDAWRTSLGHTVALLPPLWFFGFLYYTDVGSVFFILATLLCVQRQRRWAAATLGAVSLLFRQTNVVWLVYIVASSLLSDLSRAFPALHDPLASQAGLADLGRSVASVVGILGDRRNGGRLASLLLRNVAPFVPVLAGVAWFVRWNGSIVLGDQSNHQAGVHVPQLLYFLLFATVFGWPAILAAQPLSSSSRRRQEGEEERKAPGLTNALSSLVDSVAVLTRRTVRHMLGSASAVATTGVLCWAIKEAVGRYTIEHPFLLADNRHYTFYLWRKVWRRHEAVRFALVPVYLVCARMCTLLLGIKQVKQQRSSTNSASYSQRASH
ncbi:uncharacterized protein PSFLO_05027 [Pseudozyma flocculosa]|uniref:Dol-P-Glc:Glc(2)Man(9)GlcNAc(2)-PP-Dol alpha-1,2-glucosyltransferase n=1 Tax=Pseudozyma flocculosa TaxID=84751 RepID=A0A5C3F6B0_9BASI|nr:uncharacterized protein PSFLO_05027 [Pseudozyma flocculosa]